MTTGQELLQASTDLRAMGEKLDHMFQVIDETPAINPVIAEIMTGKLAEMLAAASSLSGWFQLVASGRDGVATCEECGRGLASDEVFGQTLGMTLCGSCVDERRERQWEQADEGEGGNE